MAAMTERLTDGGNPQPVAQSAEHALHTANWAFGAPLSASLVSAHEPVWHLGVVKVVDVGAGRLRRMSVTAAGTTPQTTQSRSGASDLRILAEIVVPNVGIPTRITLVSSRSCTGSGRITRCIARLALQKQSVDPVIPDRTRRVDVETLGHSLPTTHN
jgi:hypothetical protein